MATTTPVGIHPNIVSVICRTLLVALVNKGFKFLVSITKQNAVIEAKWGWRERCCREESVRRWQWHEIQSKRQSMWTSPVRSEKDPVEAAVRMRIYFIPCEVHAFISILTCASVTENITDPFCFCYCWALMLVCLFINSDFCMTPNLYTDYCHNL